MARIILDALSHQAVRELGTEQQVYGPATTSSGRWAGKRIAGLRAALNERGHELLIETPGKLAGADVFIVAGRSQLTPFSTEDIAALSDLLARGCGLLLMANHRGMIVPQQTLAEALALPVSFNDISVVDGPTILIEPHPVTLGVATLAVRNSCSIRPMGGQEVLARFTEPGHLFAVAARLGAGRVVATADSGFVASLDDAGHAMYETAGNARFIGNALDWLIAG